jgi:hypothetical protein
MERLETLLCRAFLVIIIFFTLLWANSCTVTHEIGVVYWSTPERIHYTVDNDSLVMMNLRCEAIPAGDSLLLY